MAIAKGYPIEFTPEGVTDSFDGTRAFRGACRNMANLILSQNNPELLVARPGVGAPITTFSGFNTPTYVSVVAVSGTIAYGMVSTARTPGYDEPFAYDLVNNVFITISGVTSGNVPASPNPTGTWVPPTMTAVSTNMIVTHPGFSGVGSNFFGVIDISTPAAPAWSSSNTTGNLLPSVPTVVANFNNRAWFACGNVAYYTDVLLPTLMTNAGQSVTAGDATPILAMVGLPIATTSSGVIQSLSILKGYQIWQVTGDASISTLALNFVSLTTGTNAPRSVAQTPAGIFFASTDAPYFLDMVGNVKPIDAPGRNVPDLQYPFQNCTEPTRTTGAFTAGTYRLCMNTIDLYGNEVTSDYWLSTHRQRWSGSHTFPYDCIAPYQNDFILSHSSLGAALFLSTTLPTIASLYQDTILTSGTYSQVGFTCTMESSTLPKVGDMAEKQVIESTIELSGDDATFTIVAVNQDEVVLDAVTIVSNTSSVYLWGAGGSGYFWGAGTWNAGTLAAPDTYTIPWTLPLVFQKVGLRVAVTASNNIAIGSFYARFQSAGYTNM